MNGNPVVSYLGFAFSFSIMSIMTEKRVSVLGSEHKMSAIVVNFQVLN
jgi:hypothetical protein